MYEQVYKGKEHIVILRIIFYQKEQDHNKVYLIRKPKLNMFLTFITIFYHIGTSLGLDRNIFTDLNKRSVTRNKTKFEYSFF